MSRNRQLAGSNLQSAKPQSAHSFAAGAREASLSTRGQLVGRNGFALAGPSGRSWLVGPTPGSR
eukprot:1313500-Alexandrium_andersonii.AAC.1